MAQNLSFLANLRLKIIRISRNEKAKPIAQSGRTESSGPAMGFLPEGDN
jgi:hypothetical protein